MCGRYQEDTTNIRKAGVAAKKAGIFVDVFPIDYGKSYGKALVFKDRIIRGYSTIR